MSRLLLTFTPNFLSVLPCFPIQLLLAMKSQLDKTSTLLDPANKPLPYPLASSAYPTSLASSASCPLLTSSLTIPQRGTSLPNHPSANLLGLVTEGAQASLTRSLPSLTGSPV